MSVQGRIAAVEEFRDTRRQGGFERISPCPALTDYVLSYDHQEVNACVESSRPFAVSLFPLLVFYLGGRRNVFEYAGRRPRVLPEAIALGPCDHRVADVVDAGYHRDFTIVFQPAGFYRLFHISPAEISNHAYDCRDVLGSAFAGIHERLAGQTEPWQLVRIVEDALMRKVPGALSGSRMQKAAELLLRAGGGVSLSSVADSFGFSDSSWRRHFTCAIGVQPKRYARMLRFHRAVTLKRESPHLSWTQIAHEAGFYDQSHFIGEFREMGGACPSDFMREIDAAPVEMTSACYSFGGNLQVFAEGRRTLPPSFQGVA